MPSGLAIDDANRHARKLVQATIESIVADRPDPSTEQLLGMCLDKGYDDAEVRALL